MVVALILLAEPLEAQEVVVLGVLPDLALLGQLIPEAVAVALHLTQVALEVLVDRAFF